jgi:hypothetical protein
MDLCAANQLDCRDARDYFIERAAKAWQEGHLLWWLDDTHWNEEGHEVFAEYLERELGLAR